MSKNNELIMNIINYPISRTSDLPQSQINEIAIIDRNENVLFNSIICPNIITPLQKDFARFYEIDEKNLSKYPKFDEVYCELKEILNGKNVYVLNRDTMNYFNTCLMYLVGFNKKDLKFYACSVFQETDYIGLRLMGRIERDDRDFTFENKPLAICKEMNFLLNNAENNR